MCNKSNISAKESFNFFFSDSVINDIIKFSNKHELSITCDEFGKKTHSKIFQLKYKGKSKTGFNYVDTLNDQLLEDVKEDDIINLLHSLNEEQIIVEDFISKDLEEGDEEIESEGNYVITKDIFFK